VKYLSHIEPWLEKELTTDQLIDNGTLAICYVDGELYNTDEMVKVEEGYILKKNIVRYCNLLEHGWSGEEIKNEIKRLRNG
jgi:hypothetical protein